MAALQESQELREIWDPQEFQGFMVRKAPPACRESKATKETKASRERKVFPAPRAPQVRSTSSRGNQGSLVPRALRV